MSICCRVVCVDDAMTWQVGMMFSTKDRDNDAGSENCVAQYNGAWWFKQCHRCHLNGYYYKGGRVDHTARGVIWNPWKGYLYSLKFTEMKFRPYQ